MFWLPITIIGALGLALFVVETIIAAPPYRENKSDHFDGKKFINPEELHEHHYFDVLKWWLSGNDKGTWHQLSKEDVPPGPKPAPTVNEEEVHITFINHASFLIQINGQNILTDPIWSRRASPFQWIGPKRKRPPGLNFEDLPPIDTVLISHNHYDHLDIQTVLDLNEVHKPTFMVPLGVEQFLHEHQIHDTIHMDWWDRQQLGEELSISAVPARHFSARGLFDRNKTLWCGYIIHSKAGNIYFAGDTGYGEFFKDIRRRYGDIFASIIPIGAYKPRWFMESIHLSPKEAIQVHRDLQSEQSFAMHFGTFPLADDGMFEATNELKNELRGDPILQQEFRIPIEGKRQILTPKKTAKNFY